MEQEIIKWRAPEYHHTPKSADWYWAVGIVTISLAVIAFLFENILFSIVIALSTFSLVLFAARPPRKVNVEINNRGIIIDSYMYPYDSLDSFWVDENNQPGPKVILKSQKLLMPYLIILLEDTSHEAVREKLLKHLKEEEHYEPLLQKVLEIFGF